MIHFQGEITSQHDAGRFQATSPLLNSSLIQNEGACKPAAQSRLFFISSSPSVWLLLEIVISSCMLYLCVSVVSPCHYWKTNTQSKICINLRKVTENVCGLCWLVLKQDKSSVGGKSCVWWWVGVKELAQCQKSLKHLLPYPVTCTLDGWWIMLPLWWPCRCMMVQWKIVKLTYYSFEIWMLLLEGYLPNGYGTKRMLLYTQGQMHKTLCTQKYRNFSVCFINLCVCLILFYKSHCDNERQCMSLISTPTVIRKWI